MGSEGDNKPSEVVHGQHAANSKHTVHPLDRSLWNPKNLFAYFTFSWMSSALRQGKNEPLTPDDFYPMPHFETTDQVSGRLVTRWNTSKKQKPDGSYGPGSLVKACYASFGRFMVMAAVAQFIEAFLLLAQAVIVGRIVRLVQDSDSSNQEAYLYAAAFSLCSLV